MFTVTEQAATQIRKAAKEGEMADLYLRIAASRGADGAIQYQMGFDELTKKDIHLACEGVDIIIATKDKELLQGATLDFVELEPGDFQFIFLNPNDPSYEPPTAP